MKNFYVILDQTNIETGYRYDTLYMKGLLTRQILKPVPLWYSIHEGSLDQTNIETGTVYGTQPDTVMVLYT